MSIRRLETLVAVAETGTFAKAADKGFMTPAAVSQQMKALERELGVTLFDRNKRSPTLTPIGHALVPKAREVALAYRGLVGSVTGEVELHDELTIGAVPTTMAGLVPRAVSSLRDAHAGVRIRIVPGLSSDLLPQVDRGFLDAAILSEPARAYRHLRWRPFAEEPLIVLAPPDAAEEDPKALLETYPFIRFNRRAWVGQRIDEWLRAQNVQVSETMELDTLETISTMVFHGLGVSIVPKRCVPSPRPFALKRILLDGSVAPRLLGILSRRDSTKFRLLDIVLEELTRTVEDSGQVRAIREEDNA
ncbi:LysR family transcriptional regulator [Thioalkalivibrio sp. HK1]|uniref:LysR family transcriptional regulator n=1 Tax=Thioalkalivibrio sp. HK1 TaxID=1469245 RepID=UPI00046EFC80|nr:LysR family transcriptional regulator [Thioalkalivibrio sp. HK1]